MMGSFTAGAAEVAFKHATRLAGTLSACMAAQERLGQRAKTAREDAASGSAFAITQFAAPPVASMAGSILIPPEVKIHTWKQCAQGAALLSANVTRIDVTGHVLLFQDASEFLH